MEFKDILKKRKSVRTFLPQPIPRGIIEDIIAAGVAAPTSCNQQLWKFVIVEDPRIKEELIKKAYSSTLIRRAPVVIVVLYDGWNYKEAVQAGSMAMMNMINRCCDLGIGASCMNSFGNAQQIKKILGIPAKYVVNAFVVVGYSNDTENNDVPVIPRRTVAEVASYNGFDSRLEYAKTYSPEKWTTAYLDDYQAYFCRKTILGKEMDLAADLELSLIKDTVEKIQQPVLDLFSYDGSYLKYFSSPTVYSLNINEPTVLYVGKAAENLERKMDFRPILLKDLQIHRDTIKDIKQVTLIMKAERLPKDVLADIFFDLSGILSSGTALTVISRKSNIFLNLFHSLLKVFFGDDIRKTGMYAFWGPCAPINVADLNSLLKRSQWEFIKKDEYFFVPAFFQQILQMMVQYFKSGKTSYLHRERHVNVMTKLLDSVLRFQGLRKTQFGSLAVLNYRLTK